MNALYFFFFQAEDGIRDLTVTGVQTCALPIWSALSCPINSIANSLFRSTKLHAAGRASQTWRASFSESPAMESNLVASVFEAFPISDTVSSGAILATAPRNAATGLKPAHVASRPAYNRMTSACCAATAARETRERGSRSTVSDWV